MNERLGQRRLTSELRAAIDSARWRPTAPAINRVRELIEEHPRGAVATYVLHNLGAARLEWLYENGLLTRETADAVR